MHTVQADTAWCLQPAIQQPLSNLSTLFASSPDLQLSEGMCHARHAGLAFVTCDVQGMGMGPTNKLPCSSSRQPGRWAAATRAEAAAGAAACRQVVRTVCVQDAAWTGVWRR